MAGSCCGGASKSEHAKVVVAPVLLTTTEEVKEQQAAKSECCTDKPSRKERKAQLRLLNFVMRFCERPPQLAAFYFVFFP